MSRRKADNSGPVEPSSASDHFYDDEAANNAFFNAPKVTLRNRRPKAKQKEMEEEDEERIRETYDENADKELNEKIAQHLKDFFAKKITAKNAFETPILDKLPTVAEMEPLQCVGTMLDASARVYAFRVDNTHCECFNVRTNFDEDKDKKKKPRDNLNDSIDDDAAAKRVANADQEEDDDDKSGDGDEPVDGDEDVANAADDGAPAVDVDGNPIAPTKKKKKTLKVVHNAELNERLDDLYKQSDRLVKRFVRYTLPPLEPTGSGGYVEPITEERLLENFEDYSSRMQEILVSRRVGIPFIEQKTLGLNRNAEQYSIDDPIYHKVAKHFEEGCAQSFVNNEVLTNDTGDFLILHTNWRNNEPFATTSAQLSAELMGRPHNNAELFENLEAALERALAPNPSRLELLQEFCDDEDENLPNMAEKEERSDVRVLGRKSQDPRTSTGITPTQPSTSKLSNGSSSSSDERIPPNQQQMEKQEQQLRQSVVTRRRTSAGGGEHDEGETESSSVSGGINEEEEERSRREHDELAKFQMYLDEKEAADAVDIKPTVKHDPFLDQHFFVDNFARPFLRPATVADYADIDKAVLHCLTDADAQHFGISSQLLMQIKSELKPKRRISEGIYEKFIAQIPLAKSVAFNALLKSESLYAECDDVDEPNIGSLSFLVTRFAPLIDSIWHAVIKVADERDLVRANVFVGGIKTAQRALNRQLQHQAHMQQRSASRRRRGGGGHPMLTPTSSVGATPKSHRFGLRSADDTGMSPPKRQRMANGESQDTDDTTMTGSEFDETTRNNIHANRERIYFWARPRHYPLVYLGQTTDERDNPMTQRVVEMFVDMEEMLLGLDETGKFVDDSAAVGSGVTAGIADSNDGAALEMDASPIKNVNEVGEPHTNDLAVVRVGSNMDVDNVADTTHQSNYDDDFDVGGDRLADVEADAFGGENCGGDAPAGNVTNVFPFDEQPIFDHLEDDFTNDVIDARPIAVNADAEAVQPPVDDQSHWKSNSGGQLMNDVPPPTKAKKARTATAKPKRRRRNSNVNAKMGGSLTEEMFWRPAENLDPDVLKSIDRHQAQSSKPDNLMRQIAGDGSIFMDKKDFHIDVSNCYKTSHLLTSSLFSNNHFGFWRFDSRRNADNVRNVVFYSRPEDYRIQSLEAQLKECVSILVGDNQPGVSAANKAGHFTDFDPYNLADYDDDVAGGGGDAIFNDGEDISNEFGGLAQNRNVAAAGGDDYDPDLKADAVRLVHDASSTIELRLDEQLEFNGGIIKIHQSRVKAPLVKRAIATILASDSLDSKALLNLRNAYKNARHHSRLHTNSDKENGVEEIDAVMADSDEALCVPNDIAGLPASSKCNVVESISISDVEEIISSKDESSSSSSGSSEDEENDADNTTYVNKAGREMPNVGATTRDRLLIMRGEHTFESLLANLPQHLSGRTKHDLNVVNAFAIMLHMCNEHQIQLQQDKDNKSLLVTPNAMSTFKFQQSRK